MLATLFLDEGFAITLLFYVLMIPAVLGYAGVLALLVNRRYLLLRILGLVLAVVLAFFADIFIEDYQVHVASYPYGRNDQKLYMYYTFSFRCSWGCIPSSFFHASRPDQRETSRLAGLTWVLPKGRLLQN